MINDDILSDDFHQKKYINFLITASKKITPAKVLKKRKWPT